MKKIIGMTMGAMMLLSSCGDDNEETTKEVIKLETNEDRLCYAMGMNVGFSLRENFNMPQNNLSEYVDKNEIISAIKDGLNDEPYRLNLENMNPIIQEFFYAKDSTGVVSDDLKSNFNYIIGMDIAENIKNFLNEYEFSEKFNSNLFYGGFNHSFDGDSTLISETEQTEIMENFIKDKQSIKEEKMLAEMEKAYQINKTEGDAFLAENIKRKEVIETESGLQYEILVPGKGPRPTTTDKVKVHYHGTLIDGTVFDSSVERQTPIDFPVTGVISGWIEALQLMNVGSKYKLYIPEHMAYGKNPRPGGPIQPGMTLIFEVELLAIN